VTTKHTNLNDHCTITTAYVLLVGNATPRLNAGKTTLQTTLQHLHCNAATDMGTSVLKKAT
jgi:hypothetical protein